MLRVTLLTRNSEHVADVEIIPLSPLPDVVFWGTRVFKLQRPGVPSYVEALVATSLTPSPGLTRVEGSL